MKKAIAKLDIIIKCNGEIKSITTHIQHNNTFVLDTEKYPNAEILSISFTEIKLI
jgi:hypothetical protein